MSDPTPRQRMEAILADQDPSHPCDKPPAPWHRIAVNCLCDEMMEPSDGTVEAVDLLGGPVFKEEWSAGIKHIREGGS